MKQPFIFGKSVSGNYFTDRIKETKKLVNNFTYGINTILISPRRYGKTSLVKEAISRITDPDIKIVFMDIFSSRNEEEFSRIFAEAIIKQTSSKMEQWIEDTKKFLTNLAPRFVLSPEPSSEISLSFGIKPSQPEMESIMNLPEKIAKEKNCRIVVCIDEFQQIGEYPDSLHFQRFLRTYWQHHNNVSYCLFGSKKHMMNELFEKPSNPFYKFGDLINLTKIPRDEWIKFILERFKEEGKEIKKETASRICELTEDYSSYVQQLSWLVWINYEADREKEVVEESFEELLNHCSILFEQQTQNLTTYQLNFLKALIQGVEKDFTSSGIISKYDLGTPGNIAKLKNSLIKKELIEVSGKKYVITDPILKEWLRRQFIYV